MAYYTSTCHSCWLRTCLGRSDHTQAQTSALLPLLPWGHGPTGVPAQAASKAQAAAGPGGTVVAALPRHQGLARALAWPRTAPTGKVAPASSCLVSRQQRKYTASFFNSSFWRKKAYRIASLIRISTPYFTNCQY